MSKEARIEEKSVSLQNLSGVGAQDAAGSAACKTHGKGWLKGPFGMAICCAAPLLLVGAIALFGISLGALASGFLSVAALLVCPVGMYLMMRMMTKQNAGKEKDGDN
jgi:hypothetical protein